MLALIDGFDTQFGIACFHLSVVKSYFEYFEGRFENCYFCLKLRRKKKDKKRQNLRIWKFRLSSFEKCIISFDSTFKHIFKKTQIQVILKESEIWRAK